MEKSNQLKYRLQIKKSGQEWNKRNEIQSNFKKSGPWLRIKKERKQNNVGLAVDEAQQKK
jgi:hypothetical protein